MKGNKIIQKLFLFDPYRRIILGLHSIFLFEMPKKDPCVLISSKLSANWRVISLQIPILNL